MKLKIKCNNKMISKFQIEECVKLLGPEYTSLSYVIDVYNHRERLEKERLNNPDMEESNYDDILGDGTGTPVGICVEDKREIKLFPFNLTDDLKIYTVSIDEKYPPEYRFIFFLFHELQHAWQQTHGKFKEEKEIFSVSKQINDYKKLPSEREANNFAKEQVNRNKNHIQKILLLENIPLPDIKLNW